MPHRHVPIFATLLLLLVLPLASMAAALQTDLARAMFARPYSSVQRCYAARESCRLCRATCPSAHRSFFNPSRPDVNVISLLQACRLHMSHVRTGMDPWCLNDKSRFFATNAFHPSPRTCAMDPSECATRTQQWARDQISFHGVSTRHSHVRLAMKIAEAEAAIHKETLSRKEYTDELNEVHKLRKWRRENILREMERHIQNPQVGGTRFYDPVFANLRGMEQNTRATDLFLYRNDFQSASVENGFVEKDTIEKIPSVLRSIASIKNGLHSSKRETDGYLADIKRALGSTHRMQMAATNVAYEATHMKDLDGEIIVMDKELLGLFAELKREQQLLAEATTRSTNNRRNLVNAMRAMISKISINQKNRCGSKVFFNPTS